jgi:hypothetical protein
MANLCHTPMEVFETLMTFIDTQIQKHIQDFNVNHPRDFVDLCLQKSASDEFHD